MTNPARKFIGMTVLVIFVMVYAFVAMVIGDITLQSASSVTRLIYFGIAGLVWTIPAGAIIWWMEHGFRLSRRPDAD
jgi:membrane-associated HD superfamily phosphohydrolase